LQAVKWARRNGKKSISLSQGGAVFRNRKVGKVKGTKAIADRKRFPGGLIGGGRGNRKRGKTRKTGGGATESQKICPSKINERMKKRLKNGERANSKHKTQAQGPPQGVLRVEGGGNSVRKGGKKEAGNGLQNHPETKKRGGSGGPFLTPRV